jgi:hypothetical protein
MEVIVDMQMHNTQSHDCISMNPKLHHITHAVRDIEKVQDTILVPSLEKSCGLVSA